MKLILASLLLCMALCGCSNPRVYQCGECGKAFGVSGGNLPGQVNLKCRCGGRFSYVRPMTDNELRRGAISQ